MTGTTISHFNVLEKLGAGGMGEVYLAKDTKLDRRVALKVVPAHALASEDDRARFYREARAAAALNHANIGHVYEIDEAMLESGETRPFIAMEYVDGESLAEKIAHGPLPLQAVTSIGAQIASGLAAAHAKDIVHRDVKPSNVMLTKAGEAKILDFGLAKTAASTKLTQMGSTLGTVAYMSPEQARGEEVDRRSDIWSLGVMLYEMISGRMPFAGDYEQAVVYGILNADPEPLTGLRTGVPMELERIVDKCLTKEADLRYGSAGDLIVDLRRISMTQSSASHAPVAAVPATADASANAAPAAATRTSEGRALSSQARGRLWLLPGLLLGFALAWMLLGDSEPVRELSRFEIELPHAVDEMHPGWSPDGRELYYLARAAIDDPVHVRRYTLATGESSVVPGTENASDVSVSPDGRWLIVSDRSGNQYRRALRSGGAFTDIPGAVSNPRDRGIYGPDGRFYFSTEAWEIASTGPDGDVIVHTEKDSSVAFLAVPVVAPGGKSVFFSDWTAPTNSRGTFRLVNHAPGFERVSSQYTFLEILDNGYALVIPVGLTSQPAALAPINPETGELLGPAVPIARLKVLGFDFSPTGHLVYREQPTDADAYTEPLFRFGGDGNATKIWTPLEGTGDFAAARGRNAVVRDADTDNPGERDLYVVDLDTGVQTRLTRGGNNAFSEWSPDDRYVYFRSYDGNLNTAAIMRRRADASEPAELVLANTSNSGGGVYHPAVTPDGSLLLFTHDAEGEAHAGLYRIPIGDPLRLDVADAERIAQAEDDIYDPDPSPDGRYVVYRTGGGSVLAASIDGLGEVEITSDGAEPVWSPDGAWIYFLRQDQEIFRVAVTTEPVLSLLGTEESVFQTNTHLHYDIASDGSVLVAMPEGATQSDGSRIWIVLNLADHAERIAPKSQ